METEENKGLNIIKTSSLLIITIVVALVVYYTVMLSLAPGKKMKELRAGYEDNSKEKSELVQAALADSHYVTLLRKKAFLQSKIAMAESDSIYLILNFADSTANLEIAGVVVHEVKMKEFEISSILTRGNQNVINKLLSTPLTIESAFATIAKEPVMIKMAPKDTSEYKPDIMPDTAATEPVFYKLNLSGGIQLFVYQQEKDLPADSKAFRKFDVDERKKRTKEALGQVASFKVPDYTPFIRLELPRKDARIIYRALPRKGQVAVWF